MFNWKRITLVAAVLAIARVSVFWLLIYLEKAGKQTIDSLVLVVLLIPEGFVIPKDQPLTALFGMLFSLLLVFGSGVIVVMLFGVVKLFRTAVKKTAD